METKYSFLHIDELRLDRECQHQASLYMEHAMKLARARKDYDEAHATLSVTEAETSKRIRGNPSKYGLAEKPTETSIKEAIALNADVLDSAKEVREAKHALDVCQAAVTALDHRKSALKLMVDLRGQEYYSTPMPTAKGTKAVNESAKGETRRLGQRRADREED